MGVGERQHSRGDRKCRGGGTTELRWPGTISLGRYHLSHDPKDTRKPAVALGARAMPGQGKSKQKGLGWDVMEPAGRGGVLASYCRDTANSRAA